MKYWEKTGMNSSTSYTQARKKIMAQHCVSEDSILKLEHAIMIQPHASRLVRIIDNYKIYNRRTYPRIKLYDKFKYPSDPFSITYVVDDHDIVYFYDIYQ
jgi:hypothetical protein